MNKKIKALICMFIMALSILLCNCEIEASAVQYVKVNTNYIMKDNYGFTKLTINGKKQSIKYGVKSFKFILKYEGKYVIKTVNKRGQKKKTTFLVDGTKPKIKCVTSEDKVKVTITDDRKLSTVSLNGRKVKSKFAISTAGSYKIIAKDKAGNKTVRTINVNKSTTQETEVPNVTDAPQVTATVNATMLPEDTPKENDCSHIWTKSVFSEPTCEMDGVEKSVCSICGKIKYETIPMIGHDYSLKSISESYKVKEATCTDAGIYYYACKNCGKKSNQTYEVSKLGHDYIEEAAEVAFIQGATCTQGAKYYKICSRCHMLGEETWTASEFENHKYNTKKILSEATETMDQSYELCCDTCGISDGKVYYELGTHLDNSAPHVYGTAYLSSLNHTTYCCVVDTYYHDVMYEGSICGKKYEYHSYMENVVQCTDPLGVSFHACAVDEQSGIKQYQIAVLNVTKEELEGIIKNNTQEYVEQLVNNYVSTGLMMPNAQNVSIGTYVSMLGKSGTYGYMYILVEDMAGNITIVSTESLLF